MEIFLFSLGLFLTQEWGKRTLLQGEKHAVLDLCYFMLIALNLKILENNFQKPEMTYSDCIGSEYLSVIY